jgi:hypothetical protein
LFEAAASSGGLKPPATDPKTPVNHPHSTVLPDDQDYLEVYSQKEEEEQKFLDDAMVSAKRTERCLTLSATNSIHMKGPFMTPPPTKTPTESIDQHKPLTQQSDDESHQSHPAEPPGYEKPMFDYELLDDTIEDEDAELVNSNDPHPLVYTALLLSGTMVAKLSLNF